MTGAALAHTYADATKRGKGRCSTCVNREKGAARPEGGYKHRCREFGDIATNNRPACYLYDIDPVVTETQRAWDRAHRNGPRQQPIRAAAPAPERCIRCGSANMYRDHDGSACLTCGRHTWENARR